MKRWLILTAAIMLVAILGACGGSTTTNRTVVRNEVPTVQQQTVPPAQLRASAELTETGKRKWRVGDMKNAVKSFNKAIEKYPSNFEAYYWLAVIERDGKHWNDADRHFAKSLQFCPQGRWEARVRVDWGLMYELQGQNARASQQYDLALVADPNFRSAQDAKRRVLPLPSASHDNDKDNPGQGNEHKDK